MIQLFSHHSKAHQNCLECPQSLTHMILIYSHVCYAPVLTSKPSNVWDKMALVILACSSFYKLRYICVCFYHHCSLSYSFTHVFFHDHSLLFVCTSSVQWVLTGGGGVVIGLDNYTVSEILFHLVKSPPPFKQNLALRLTSC